MFRHSCAEFVTKFWNFFVFLLVILPFQDIEMGKEPLSFYEPYEHFMYGGWSESQRDFIEMSGGDVCIQEYEVVWNQVCHIKLSSFTPSYIQHNII
jgi:hypothetical protein